MKIILTERQLKMIFEQNKNINEQNWFSQAGQTMGRGAEGMSTRMDAHTFFQAASIIAAFSGVGTIPALISMGFSIADAYVYYKEGDKKTASLMAAFSAIPMVGGLAAKLGLTKWSAKALSELGKKIGLGQKLTAVETQAVSRITQNRALVEAEMKKLAEQATIRAATQNARIIASAEFKKRLAKRVAVETAKFSAYLVGVPLAHDSAYDMVRANTIKVKVEKDGGNWELAKEAFGSKGNKQDNEKLNMAWDAGWRPGEIVPEKFRTKLYQDIFNEELENMRSLAALQNTPE
jgi:hypothetical protein